MRYKLITLTVLTRLIQDAKGCKGWQPSLNTVLVLFDIYAKCEFGKAYFKAASTLESELNISPAMRKKIFSDLQSWGLIRRTGATKSGVLIWECLFKKSDLTKISGEFVFVECGFMEFAIIPNGVKDKYRCLVESALYALCFAPTNMQRYEHAQTGEKLKVCPYSTARIHEILGRIISDDTVRKSLICIESDGGFWVDNRIETGKKIKIKTAFLEGQRCVFLPSKIPNASIGVEFYDGFGARENDLI